MYRRPRVRPRCLRNRIGKFRPRTYLQPSIRQPFKNNGLGADFTARDGQETRGDFASFPRILKMCSSVSNEIAVVLKRRRFPLCAYSFDSLKNDHLLMVFRRKNAVPRSLLARCSDGWSARIRAARPLQVAPRSGGGEASPRRKSTPRMLGFIRGPSEPASTPA
jgi:hypothetical protein